MPIPHLPKEQERPERKVAILRGTMLLPAEDQTFDQLLSKLTTRERRFVCEYLIDGNGARAARVAGYSPRTARVIASQNLSKLNIRTAVEAGLHALAVRCEVSAEKVMRELAAIAFSNYLHYEVAEDSTLVVAEGAPPEAALAIARTKHKRRAKEDGTFVIESEFTLWDKIAALTLLGKRLKLWTERVEVENSQDKLYKELLKSLKKQTDSGNSRVGLPVPDTQPGIVNLIDLLLCVESAT